eukprot:8692456-Alexandrium_andersonii.AAC.1
MLIVAMRTRERGALPREAGPATTERQTSRSEARPGESGGAASRTPREVGAPPPPLGGPTP